MLTQELAAFDTHGARQKVIAQANGYLVLDVTWPLTGVENLELHIGFSPFHPFARPLVSAPNATFERHQHPFSKVLCLLTQESRQWYSRQLVADFIAERLERLREALGARAASNMERAAEFEEHAADTLVAYFGDGNEKASVVLFDGAMSLPVGDFGILELQYTPRAQGEGAPFEALLTSVRTASGGGFAKTFGLPSDRRNPATLPGRWVKVDKPPLTNDPAQLLQFAEAKVGEITQAQRNRLADYRAVENNTMYLTGIVFPDEVTYGASGASWLFVVGRRKFDGVGKPLGAPRFSTVLGQRAGEADFFARFPVGKALRRKRVLLVGCGAIGSFAAAELARSGVGEITLVDGDLLEPGNSVRWLLGRTAWGWPKAEALAGFLQREFPFTNANFVFNRIGEATSDAKAAKSGTNQLAFFWREASQADIVVDCSASTEVQHALAWLCSELKKPFVMGYATEGAVGGVVARFETDPVTEWSSLQDAWDQGAMPSPLVDPGQTVTPVGCNQPTFVGGSFDLEEVSLAVARGVVGTLCPDDYPLSKWTISQLRLRNDEGERIPPSWALFSNPGQLI